MNEYFFTFSKDSDFTLIKEKVENCENEVIFETTEGDRIALKSTLGQFIFFSMIHELDFLYSSSKIRCKGKHDRELLSSVLVLCENH